MNFSRCDWERKDLRRFVCLKIWPRLPKESNRHSDENTNPVSINAVSRNSTISSTLYDLHKSINDSDQSGTKLETRINIPEANTSTNY